MGSGISKPVSEAAFICMGMTKDKWPFLTVATIQNLLDNPDLFDDDPEAFRESFFFYYDWYWRIRNE